VDELKSYREKIDSLDRELVRLFLERMEVVKNIARYKKENHIPVLDSGREAEVIHKVKGYVDDPDMKELIAKLFGYIMEISKDIQKNTII